VYVQNNGSALVDAFDWDVNNPANSAHAYAASACADLGLGVAWYDLIQGYMQVCACVRACVCACVRLRLRLRAQTSGWAWRGTT
jgi:hypothetical protein